MPPVPANSQSGNKFIEQLDPQFAQYLTSRPPLSYVQDSDGRLRAAIIDKIELALGRRTLEDLYYNIKEKPFDIATFFADIRRASGIKLNYSGLKPSEINVKGPLVFIANHPFGLLDGMILCDIATQVRQNLRIMINSALCQDEDLAPYFLPVDFNDNKTAIRTNIRSKQLALQSLSADIPLLIFPSGFVSTAGRFGFGPVKDAPWTTFTAKLIKSSQATVIPVFFHGQNSRKFHIASHIAEPLRMGLLAHEALKKFNQTINVSIGAPMNWSSLQNYTDRRQLTDFLYQSVQKLQQSDN